MRTYNRIEEPPPVPRLTAPPPSRRITGLFPDWRQRFFVHGPGLRSRWAPGPGTARRAAIGLAVLAVFAFQAWTLHGMSRVRGQLAVERAELDQARISLGLLWHLAERLDEDQVAGLASLADSIRSVLSYAQGEVNLWQTAYNEQQQRLEAVANGVAEHGEAIARIHTTSRDMATRLTELGRADELKATRLAALERLGRSHSEAVDALARRSDAQEADLVAVTGAVGSLRQTLVSMDAELGGLENQLASTGSAFGKLDTRIEELDGWIAGFRRAGLSGEAVESRFASMASELRRVRMHVDSLRSGRSTTRSSQQQP